MKLAFVFGTRPEIIKLSALLKLAEEEPRIKLRIIHTGQHYHYNLSERFLEDLKLPTINEDISVGSLDRSAQIRAMVEGLLEIFDRDRPDMVLVQGDTNSTVSGAMAASNRSIAIAHVEAGLRSFDRRMFEETNRKIADWLSDLCFAPTKVAAGNLADDGIPPERVHLVGNTVVEVVRENLRIAAGRSTILKDMALVPNSYVLVTAHRQENVDDLPQLTGLVEALEHIELPMVYPIHPRTVERVVEFELLRRLEKIKNLTITDPLPYWDFLELSSNSRMIITDSGGIQEECTVYRRPVIVARISTERPEILGNFGVLTGFDPVAILREVERIDSDYESVMRVLAAAREPYGDGTASQRILEICLARGRK